MQTNILLNKQRSANGLKNVQKAPEQGKRPANQTIPSRKTTRC